MSSIAVPENFLHLTKFCTKRQFWALYPPSSQRAKPLAPILKWHRQNKLMFRNYIILLLIILTILFNCALIHGLLWNPYILYFDRPEFSKTSFEARDLYAEVTTYTNLIILLGLAVVMVIKYYKEKKVLCSHTSI